MSSFRTIAVVGSGALGLHYGARLAAAGAAVAFLARSELAVLRTQGVTVRDQRTGPFTVAPAQFRAAADPAEIGPVDLVIVALKTTTNGELPRLLPPLLAPHTLILTLQNGLGSDELLAAHFGAGRVLGALCFIAATRSGPGEVSVFHPGSITLGEFGRPPQPRTHELAALFTRAGVQVKVVEDLDAARWRKLVWNVPFNGLSIAAGGVTTDVLCADPLLAAEVWSLMDEVRCAAAALGHEVPEEFARQQFDVTPPMGPYQPSSLVDFRAGRPVEVEPIWGEPLRRAQAAGVATPRLALLYALLQRVTRAAAGFTP